jgi:hypothetical protein
MSAPKLKIRALLAADAKDEGWPITDRVVDGVAYVIESVGMRVSDIRDAMSALTEAEFDALVVEAITRARIDAAVRAATGRTLVRP